MSDFTHARNSRGEIQRVPRRWLDEGHPFAGQFTQTPSAKQEEGRSSTPDESWTVPQLRHEAKRVGIDLTGTTKADILSAIERASATDDPPQEG